MKIETKDGKAYISAPYNPDFVARIKAMGARWEASSRCWVVREDAIDAARAAMMAIYGENDETPAAERVTLIVHAVDGADALRGAITLAGKTIAKAFGRDSGAKIGDDVAFITGAPYSAGSAKGWFTVIPADAMFEVYDVARSKAEEAIAHPPKGFEIRIKGGNALDRAALVEERAKLLERIAIIDKILGETNKGGNE